MRRFIAALTVLLLSSWGVASAQSLVEVAKREKERRKQLEAGKVKSFNDSDLQGRGIPSAVSPVPPDSSPAEGQAPSETQSEEQKQEEDPTRTEAYWRDRVASIDRRIADIQSQLNAPGFAQDPSNMSRRRRLEEQLQEARAERGAVVEEARRKGVPPGWVR